MKKTHKKTNIADIVDGMDSAFWVALKGIVSEEMESIEIQVLEQEDLTDKQRDDLRRWRNFLKYFIDLPERIVASVKSGETEPTNYDPFLTIRDGIVK